MKTKKILLFITLIGLTLFTFGSLAAGEIYSSDEPSLINLIAFIGLDLFFISLFQWTFWLNVRVFQRYQAGKMKKAWLYFGIPAHSIFMALFFTITVLATLDLKYGYLGTYSACEEFHYLTAAFGSPMMWLLTGLGIIIMFGIVLFKPNKVKA